MEHVFGIRYFFCVDNEEREEINVRWDFYKDILYLLMVYNLIKKVIVLTMILFC